jgi:hypothetical protein
MNITPEEFLSLLKKGKALQELNRKPSPLVIDQLEVRELVKKYGHSVESAIEYLSTDYSNGFTICSQCGTFSDLGKGFIKHLSNGCLHCEGESKHRVYHINRSPAEYGGFPARDMSVMFDDGMSYCVSKMQVEKFKSLLSHEG